MNASLGYNIPLNRSIIKILWTNLYCENSYFELSQKTPSNFYQYKLDTPNYYKIFFTFYFLTSIRTSGKNINFDDKNINKSNFYKNKKLFNLNDIDVNKILVSKEEPYDTQNSLKYFIGYNDDDVIRPLFIILPQMIGYVKHFDINKTMSFKVNDNKLLKNAAKYGEKISNLLNIKFDSKLVCGDEDI